MITIHCGLHKTGSSSIQLALELCTKRGRKIVTPKPGDDRSEHGWRERLNKLATSSDAVFSDEHLLGSPYDGYQLAPERVGMLRETLSGSRFQIVLYLRPHVDWLPSVYLQGVQEGRMMSPEDFWSAVKNEPYLRWVNLTDLVRRESGAEIVNIRAHTRSRDVVADFFDVVGLGKPPRTRTTIIRENVSIGSAQAVLLRQLYGREDVDDEQRKLFRTVFQHDLAAGRVRDISPFPVLTQLEIAEQLRGDWASLALHQTPDAEFGVFRSETSRYDNVSLPHAGASLVDRYVGEEALRSLQILILRQRLHEKPRGLSRFKQMGLKRWWGRKPSFAVDFGALRGRR